MRGQILGNRSFTLVAVGLPLLIAAVVVAACWDPPSHSLVAHNHGSNRIHTHWHTHDVGIPHDHTHPGIERIEHSHRHEHGHVHGSKIRAQRGGHVVAIGHAHQNSETRNYWAEVRCDGNELILHFWVEAQGTITPAETATTVLEGTLLEQYRPRETVQFTPRNGSFCVQLSPAQRRYTEPAVIFRRVALEGEAFDFKIAIP